jgi:hypothetical protein
MAWAGNAGHATTAGGGRVSVVEPVAQSVGGFDE